MIVREHREALKVLRQVPNVLDVQTFGERAHVRTSPDDRDAAARIESALRATGLTVESIRPIHNSLEDVFIARLEEARP